MLGSEKQRKIKVRQSPEETPALKITGRHDRIMT